MGGLFLLGSALPEARAAQDVLMWHNDTARTGQNLEETQLTLDNVNTNSFGLLFSYPVDGFVYAQPLYLSGVTLPGGGVRNLVFVATEHDSVFAFDADDPQRDNGQPLWHTSFTNPAAGISSVPTSDLSISEPAELGITGTPVIDPASGTLYVVAHTKEVTPAGSIYPQRLHALDVATGQEKFGGPVLINATSPGSGSNANDAGQVVFDEQFQFQRPGLVLLNGFVYAAFASAGDVGPYHGWILGFDAQTLQLTQVFNATPNGYEGGIWASGGAPSVDSQGYVYCMTGNGDFDPSISDFGDTFLKLRPSGTNLSVVDYFTPYNQAALNAGDGDLGSGGPMILPDSAGSAAHPHLLIGCGKEGTVYLVDRDNMGHFNATNDSQIVQSLYHEIGGTWSNPAYLNGWVYYQGTSDALKAFSISNGVLSLAPVSQNPNSVWSYPGGTPSISANGTNDAIVWLLQTDTFYQNAPAILHAYNATNLAQELYNSGQAGTRDQPGLAQKFSVPVIANGKVYVSGGSLLSVFGSLGGPAITSQPASQVATPGSSVTLSVGASGSPSLAYQWIEDGQAIIGATNASLVLTNLSFDLSGTYSVQVTNSYGSVASADAALLVVQAPSLSIDQDQQMLLTGASGATYQIQFQDPAAPGQSWQRLLELTLPGESSSPDVLQASFNDPDPATTQRLYRAMVLPPIPSSSQ